MVPEASMMQETLFNLGCRNANGLGTSAQAIVDAIYDDFKDRKVQRVNPSSGTIDDVGMKYWGGASKIYTADVLAHGDGRCGAWTRLFTDVLRTQGIDAQITVFEAPLPPQAAVATFSQQLQQFYPGYDPAGIKNLKRLLFVKNWALEVNPFTPTNVAGIPAQGIPAQTSLDPQSFFYVHFVVEYEGNYYDPSYGSDVFESQLDWEDASLAAFGLEIKADPPLPGGENTWIWKADPKGTVETVPQLLDYSKR